MKKRMPAKNIRKTVMISTALFSVLLLLLSSLVIYYSWRDRRNRILTAMDMVLAYTDQEFENITSGFWQTYLPLYESEESLAMVWQYFSSDEEFTPMERSSLAKLFSRICLCDERIAWVAFYADSRDINYFLCTNDIALQEIPEDFPWLSQLENKTRQMEILSAEQFSGTAGSTFAISGGVPVGSGSILIGYKTDSLAESSRLFPSYISTMEYYVVSDRNLVYHSGGAYDSSAVFFPSEAFEGCFMTDGEDKYGKTILTANASSYVVCAISRREFVTASVQDVPLLCGVFALFLMFTAFIEKNIIRRVNGEVDVLRRGVSHLNEQSLDYLLPEDFVQTGLPEIARDINRMNARLNESIRRAYYFELKQKDAQIAELQATFSPHFLYNSLEMLRNKSHLNGDTETAELIANLASVFRSFIGTRIFIPIREELALGRKYLSLLSARYGDRVNFSYDIDSDVLKYGIIRNVFQLLIENCFVHGFVQMPDGSEIRFGGRLADHLEENFADGLSRGEDILLWVEDNGSGMTEDALAKLSLRLEEPIRQGKENYGLKNIHQRLKLFYGPDYGLKIRRGEAGGLLVLIRIRRITVEEYEASAGKTHRLLNPESPSQNQTFET